MNTFIIFAISFAILGSCWADDDSKEKKREKVVSFYKCLSCGPKEALTAYGKCEQFKPEKSKAHLEECLKKVLPEEVYGDSAAHWEHFCGNPAGLGKTFDCLYNEEYFKTLTEEDIASLKKFRDCAKGINEQYCKE
ncbi:unnamed protein product [Larinioides sclopetarius]|uniref:Uncharacterized protein n=1 Tax=Larinioides sclopetarius TaxID=280406 RepID=A0AAV1ZT44_9ARAC